MKQQYPTPNRSEAGVTLVELLIAVLLFAVLSAGALVVLSGQQRGTMVQQQASNTLDSARSALDALTRQLRVAKAGIPDGRVLVVGAVMPPGTIQCPAASRWIAVVQVLNSSTGPDRLRVLVPEGSEWGTLSRATNPADTWMYMRTTDGTAPARLNNEWVLLTNFDQAVLFRGWGPYSSGTAGEYRFYKWWGSFAGIGNMAPGAVLMRARWREYTVSTTNFGNTTYPALTVTRRSPIGVVATEPAALGIEDIQVALAVDGVLGGIGPTGNAEPDGFIRPEVNGAANADEWVFNAPGESLIGTGVLADTCQLQDLRAIRISIVARGTSEGGRNVAGGRPALEDRAAGPADDVYRVVLSSVVALR